MVSNKVRSLYYLFIGDEFTGDIDKDAIGYLDEIACIVYDDLGAEQEGNVERIDSDEVANLIIKDMLYD